MSFAELAGTGARTQLNECQITMQIDLCARMIAEKGMYYRHKMSQACQFAPPCQDDHAPASDEGIYVNVRQLPVKLYDPVSNCCSVRQELLQQHRLDPGSPAFKAW